MQGADESEVMTQVSQSSGTQAKASGWPDTASPPGLQMPRKGRLEVGGKEESRAQSKTSLA